MSGPLPVIDLGRMPYREAYAVQLRNHEEVLASRDGGHPEIGRLLMVEHEPPVITVTRRPGAVSNLVATPDQLKQAGVTVEETDRGGDITYHGPGQLVVYPILDLNHLKLRLHDYMRLLEAAAIAVCADFGVQAERDASATGVWVPRPEAGGGGGSAKICAMGVRIRRWVSLHGLALNVTTNLQHFNLIVPCGLAGRPVTSLKAELGERCPSMSEVKASMIRQLSQHALAAMARPKAAILQP